jgi:hypothetical protein
MTTAAAPAAAPKKYGLPEYLRFGFAGALCCSITHTAGEPPRGLRILTYAPTVVQSCLWM